MVDSVEFHCLADVLKIQKDQDKHIYCFGYCISLHHCCFWVKYIAADPWWETKIDNVLFLPAQHPFCNFPLENPPSLDSVQLTPNAFSEEDTWIQVYSGEQSLLYVQKGASDSDCPYKKSPETFEKSSLFLARTKLVVASKELSLGNDLSENEAKTRKQILITLTGRSSHISTGKMYS